MAAREIINVRIGGKGVEWMDSQAEKFGLTRSDVVRACVAAGAGEAQAAVAVILGRMRDGL